MEGYDESIHGGLEDWDFWLRCANQGEWGSTVPEYLDWYRRRETHQDRWTNWDGGERQQAFRERLQQRYAALWQTGFPCIQVQVEDILQSAIIPEALPCDNLLAKDRPHLLLVLPWLNPHQSKQSGQSVAQSDCDGLYDGLDTDIFACAEQLIQRGWAVSVVATHQGEHAGLSRWTQLSPSEYALAV